MNPPIYDFMPLINQDKQGEPYPIGHAIAWNQKRWVLQPGQTKRRLTCIVKLVPAK